VAITPVLSIAISGLKANATKTAAVAANVVNLNTQDYQSVQVRTASLRTGPSPSGGAGVQAQLIAGGTPDTGLEFARLIEAENAYRANAAVLRRANSLSYSLLSLKAGRITKRFLDGSKVGMIQKCAAQDFGGPVRSMIDTKGP